MSVVQGRGRSLRRLASRPSNTLTEIGLILLFRRDRRMFREINLASIPVTRKNLLHDGHVVNRVATVGKRRTMASYLVWTLATLSTFPAHHLESLRHDHHMRQPRWSGLHLHHRSLSQSHFLSPWSNSSQTPKLSQIPLHCMRRADFSTCGTTRPSVLARATTTCT